MTDLGKKIGTGIEAAPIKVPDLVPVEKPLPGFVPDFTPVPVRVPEPARRAP